MKLKLFALVLALQCAWLLATTFTQEHARRTGQVILLETRPVDPRDYLRGDYLTLSYEISDVPWQNFSPARTNEPPAGSAIYVALAPGTNGFYEVVQASLQPFTPAAGQILIRGKSVFWWGSTNSAEVEYGLERYYVREGTGNPRGTLTVQAVVTPAGQAAIKEVFVDGKPYAEAMREAGQ
ncbi:MAG TPA: GDYXXLXY domain-containing protein [Dongiaceae bacterium]|nr:GDYXXLXY domain-containing protein [Dongiaceae bacterium]